MKLNETKELKIMHKLKKFLSKLEKEKVITRKPHPIYLFLLAIFSLVLLLIVNPQV